MTKLFLYYYEKEIGKLISIFIEAINRKMIYYKNFDIFFKKYKDILKKIKNKKRREWIKTFNMKKINIRDII